MIELLPFNDHVQEYEAWFERYPFVFQTEVAAIKTMLPRGRKVKGIEIGVGTGRFAQALGIKDGIEPAPQMRALATRRGIFTLNAVAEELPYRSGQFDFVLMNFCISYLHNVQRALEEAYRVLKAGGAVIVGFVEKNSPLGQRYERKRANSVFYKQASFYTARAVISKLKKAGFGNLTICQTLFHQPGFVKTVEEVRPGYGAGSYILIKAAR